jgi:hypothetical protein
MSELVSDSVQLKAHLSISCGGCKANAHEVFHEPNLHTVGSCNKRSTVGGCFGIIYYPIKNPSLQTHKRQSEIVASHIGA